MKKNVAAWFKALKRFHRIISVSLGRDENARDDQNVNKLGRDNERCYTVLDYGNFTLIDKLKMF